MRHCIATPTDSWAFAPVVSLEQIASQRNADDSGEFDIPDTETPLPDEQIAQAEAFAALHRFMAALPARDQMIVRRVFWDGQTQTALAADLGVSKMAISKAFARICRHGREALADYQYVALAN